jgi:hypothetical protein
MGQRAAARTCANCGLPLPEESRSSAPVDLAGVLRWRIGRELARLRRAMRHAARLRVDDDGTRHAAFLAANAERKAELVELAHRLAHRSSDPRLEAEQARLSRPGDQRPHDAPSGPPTAS